MSQRAIQLQNIMFPSLPSFLSLRRIRNLSLPAPSRPHLRSTPACITDQHLQNAPQSLLALAAPGSPSHPSQRQKTSLATISSRLLVLLVSMSSLTRQACHLTTPFTTFPEPSP
jgi:hypothetical protein